MRVMALMKTHSGVEIAVFCDTFLDCFKARNYQFELIEDAQGWVILERKRWWKPWR